MFIIEGYGLSQKTIDSFNCRTVYLESEHGESITLSLQEVLKGQMELTQAIFCLTNELQSNTTYFLKYSNQTKEETIEMRKWNSDIQEYENVFWRTSENKSSSPLSPNLTIEFEHTEVDYFGCGPAAHAVFDIEYSLNSEAWYFTEVVELGTNKKSTYYLDEWDGKLFVGHGMCSGAFRFNDKGKYKVRFTPMNTAGESLKSTAWKIFDSPFSNAKTHLED